MARMVGVFLSLFAVACEVRGNRVRAIPSASIPRRPVPLNQLSRSSPTSKTSVRVQYDQVRTLNKESRVRVPLAAKPTELLARSGDSTRADGRLDRAAMHDSGPATARRELLMASVAAGMLQDPLVARAAAPQNLMLTGADGEFKTVNGRWTISFGKKLNGKEVYKKDGESWYLMFNDCGQFQINKKATGECIGVGINQKGVWSFDGTPNPSVKVKPVEAGEFVPIKRVDAVGIARKEAELMAAEREVNTFRGTLDNNDEDSGDRLMKKMGAKIRDGM